MAIAPLSARPTWAEIDLEALAGNYRELCSRLGGETRVIASIKANGYGHGVVAVAKTLDAEGVFALATGSCDDAVAVREAGVAARIVLFGGPLPDAMPNVLHHELTPTVYDLETALAVSKAAREPTAVWIEVDAGLGRLGVAIEEAESFATAVAALPDVIVEGLYTHLPFVDASGRDWAVAQLAPFRRLIENLRRSGLSIPVTQALSSAGVLAGLDGGCSAVCPGHILYGVPPAAADVVDASSFRPVLRALKTRLIHVAAHREARRAGIGGGKSLGAGSITGVVPFGRYDGYRDARGTQAQMLVRGRRVPVRGLSLEHTTLDLTGLGEPTVGDDVVVLGKQGDDEITLAELAGWQDASPIEVLMAFGRRLGSVY